MENPKVILLVEDELPVRKFVSEILHQAAYKVVSASSSADAIMAFHSSREAIDLLLTDVDLPGGISGVELAEQLAAARPGLRVLLMSGSARQSLAFEDNLHCIRKPFLPARLLQQVDEVLSSGSGLRFRRDCHWVQHLLAIRYPELHVECEQQHGNYYLLRLRLQPQDPAKEVSFSVREFVDGNWEDKVVAALDQLQSR